MLQNSADTYLPFIFMKGSWAQDHDPIIVLQYYILLNLFYLIQKGYFEPSKVAY